MSFSLQSLPSVVAAWAASLGGGAWALPLLLRPPPFGMTAFPLLPCPAPACRNEFLR